ncbi:hypothetical protein GCM10010326_36800 [Streptomyces xanthochromogenes]|uniref:Uncharacterized protein n=1 Tax=Streptomyces xanthochromogenes TaxID=67384 RepID=A0ABQ3AAP5_9ACTN|nr:hypothetical protein GCM10010326_36800 [Streptomyces xanthochromogenes]
MNPEVENSEVSCGEANEEDKGNPSKGGPGATRTGVVEEVGQPETAGMVWMDFGLRAAPFATTAIVHTSPTTSQYRRRRRVAPLEQSRL